MRSKLKDIETKICAKFTYAKLFITIESVEFRFPFFVFFSLNFSKEKKMNPIALDAKLV